MHRIDHIYATKPRPCVSFIP